MTSLVPTVSGFSISIEKRSKRQGGSGGVNFDSFSAYDAPFLSYRRNTLFDRNAHNYNQIIRQYLVLVAGGS